MAISGERQVQLVAVNGAQARKLANQVDHIAPQQRLPAREANFGDAEADKDADEAEVFIERQLRILRAHFAGAAVYAFVVAAVGDGDTQAVDRAAVTIREHRMRRLRRECGDGRGSHWQLQAYTFSGLPERY